jgi:hypothetical protein
MGNHQSVVQSRQKARYVQQETRNETKTSHPSREQLQKQNSVPNDEKKTTETTTKFGAAGLLELGFEYRHVACDQHRHDDDHQPAILLFSENDGDNNEVDPSSPSSSSFCWDCATRLFHVDSNTMMTSQNRHEFLPDGPLFEEVGRVAQEVAVQEFLIPKYGMELKTVAVEDSDETKIQILLRVSPRKDETPPRTLLFITGKGLSRAGIISIKELIEQGLEQGSVLYFLGQARKRHWNVVCLDPNALGEDHGMKVVTLSMNAIATSPSSTTTKEHSISTSGTTFSRYDGHGDEIYILAHSAAGGYLVRYLADPNIDNQLWKHIIKAIVFTDSTHRIAWARHAKDPQLDQFLQQATTALYIRNNSLGNPFSFQNNNIHKQAGEEATTDTWWEQRFGTIRTVWGGTTDHSKVCWTSRHVIWDFMDQASSMTQRKGQNNQIAEAHDDR